MNFTDEEKTELANAGKGARPSQIKNAGILNQQNIQAGVSDYQNTFNASDINKELRKILDTLYEVSRAEQELRKSGDKEHADYLKQLKTQSEAVKIVNKLYKDKAKIESDAQRINNGLVDSYKEIAKSTEDLEEFRDNIALIGPALDSMAKNAKKLDQAMVDARLSTINAAKAENRRKQDANRAEHKVNVGIEDTAGQSSAKAMAKEWKELGSTLKGVVDTLNINKLAQTFAPSSRQTLQQSLQANFNLTGRQFNTFKKELFNQINTSAYSTDEVLEVMQNLSNSPIGNAQTATQYFNDIIRGQKLLGMSAQTQETLLKLGNVTGRNELKFYTGQFAKYMNSNLGLNQKQLDELVNMNANLSAQAADMGIATEAFNTTTLNEMAAFQSASPQHLAAYNQLVQRMMNDADFANMVLGMSPGEVAAYLENGGSPLALLQNAGGTASSVFGAMQTMSSDQLQNYRLYASKDLGIDDSTWSIMMYMTKHQDDLQKALLNATEASKKDAEEAMKSAEEKRLDAMTGIQETINKLSNFIAAHDDWKLETSLDHITNLLTIAVSLLGAQTAFGNVKELLSGGKLSGTVGSGLSKIGITGSGGAALTGGKALLAGGGLLAGIAGLGFGLSDAFSNVKDQSVKVSPTGNGTVDGLLSTWLSYERGMFMGNTYKGNENNWGAGVGNTLKLAGIGAGIGTLIAPGVGTLIGGGIGAAVGAIGSLIGSQLEKNNETVEKSNNELEEIRKATYQTAQNTSYQQYGMVYRYRGVSNYSTMGSATSMAMGDASSAGYPISSSYGYRNPIQTSAGVTSSFHNGIDFAAPEGTPLYSNVTGTVIGSGTLSDGANYIAVQDDKTGYIHWYAHMQQQSPLKKGQHVNVGQFVGYVGHTGKATGPHLHYSVTKPGSGLYLNNNTSVNPYSFASSNIFSGTSSETTAKTDTGTGVDLSTAFRTKAARVSLNHIGDVATPIVGSIQDLKQTIIDLSDRTSRNEKIMNSLVNRTMQSPTI